jgi:hypothetical protein
MNVQLEVKRLEILYYFPFTKGRQYPTPEKKNIQQAIGNNAVETLFKGFSLSVEIICIIPIKSF